MATKRMPVSVAAPGPLSYPAWLERSIGDRVQEHDYEQPGIWTKAFVEGKQHVGRPASAQDERTQLRPAQFPQTLQPPPEKYLTWYELWDVVQTAPGGTPEGEAATIAAVERFAQQGGCDPYGNTFDTAWDGEAHCTRSTLRCRYSVPRLRSPRSERRRLPRTHPTRQMPWRSTPRSVRRWSSSAPPPPTPATGCSPRRTAVTGGARWRRESRLSRMCSRAAATA
mmetsp:Transcript_47739/g.132500  ORF Transcript_47739/g.132500 Transcript_47739/m.132500 type:complete len:225 (-) Transcript_47739:2371-3045(-)